MSTYPYLYVWKNNTERAKFFKAPCRIVAKYRGTVLLEFKDGRRLVSSLNSIRKAKKQ